ncbi:MAG: TonB C-terminal domain-containing protein [Epsilonproteobacteria bacterium]|nr:TonB C-terminal domain-containing protein [Campylobacterota bacterium]
MNKKSSTFISGVFAIGIYVFVIGLLLFYFNSRESQKPIHYVKKNEDRIRVTMAAPKNKAKTKKKQPAKKKTTHKKKPVKKPKVKTKDTVKKQKDTRKKVIKEKVVKKVKKKKKPKKIVKKEPPKKVNKPKDLFANVSSTKKPKNIIKVSSKPVKPKQNNPIKVSKKASASDLVSSSLKTQKKSDRGIENAYFALVEEKLKGWPAQSDYAGEMAKVWFKIDPNGHFTFKVTTASANEDFNTGLIAYLEQLQRIGFGPHKGNRAYTLSVEFVATE